MARKTQHVVHNPNGGWNVKKGGAEKAAKSFANKIQAVKYARAISKKQGAELVIHKANGRIQSLSSYGKDPCPPKNKK